jgi:hypothetical protein
MGFLEEILLSMIEKRIGDPRVDALLTELQLTYVKTQGYQVTFGGTSYGLSIQTDRMTTGGAFCETALMQNDSLQYDDSVGYADVLRFDSVDELKVHLLYLKEAVKELPSWEERMLSNTAAIATMEQNETEANEESEHAGSGDDMSSAIARLPVAMEFTNGEHTV